MSNRNTVVRAIRIDADLDRSITEAAEEKGLSFNLLVNQILERFSEFDRVAEKLGFIGFAPSEVRNFLNLISTEESETLGMMSGFAGQNARQLSNILVGRNDLQGFLSTLKLMEKYLHTFSTEISRKDGEYQIIMSHTVGMKWSYFLKGMLSSTLKEIYGTEPSFEITENFLTTRFAAPQLVDAKS